MLGGLCLSARLRLHGSCHHFARCCCSSILASVLPSTFVPSLSILHSSSERLFKMQIRSVGVIHYPEIHQWLPLTLRIKSRVLTLAHAPLLGVPSHHSTSAHSVPSLPELGLLASQFLGAGISLPLPQGLLWPPPSPRAAPAALFSSTCPPSSDGTSSGSLF